jgi:hypothetical protein
MERPQFRNSARAKSVMITKAEKKSGVKGSVRSSDWLYARRLPAILAKPFSS